MSETNELETTTVTLRRNGSLTIEELDDDNKPIVVGHYDKKTGHLEFATREYSVKLYNQITTAIGSVTKGNTGATPSSNVIRTMGVKGVERVERKKLPKRPPMGPAGDSAADQFDWYIKHDPEEAIIRYKLYLDEDGKPIRRHCERKKIRVVEMKNVDTEDLPWQDISKKHRERGTVFREGEWDIDEQGYVAARETERTFLPAHVVGGFTPDDDLAPQPDVTEDSSR